MKQVKPVFIKVDCIRSLRYTAGGGSGIRHVRSVSGPSGQGRLYAPAIFRRRFRIGPRAKNIISRPLSRKEAHGGKIPVTQSPARRDRLARNAVAVGHLLYGLCPVKPDMAKQYESFGFRRALVAIRTSLVRSGPAAPIGEAAPYLRNGVTRTGVVPIGLAQGYHPPVSGRNSTMLLGNTHVRVLRVCLSSTILDLSAMPEAEAGMDVHVLRELGSSKISLDDIVAWQHSSALSVLTGLGLGCHHQFV